MVGASPFTHSGNKNVSVKTYVVPLTIVTNTHRSTSRVLLCSVDRISTPLVGRGLIERFPDKSLIGI